MSEHASIGSQRLELGASQGVFRAAAERFAAEDGARRLWRRDASLWTGAGEDAWLGWLDLPSSTRSEVGTYESLGRSAREAGVRHVVVMGMGGSSLCPDVLAHAFAGNAAAPELLVLDSTVPAQVARIAQRVDVERALFIVPSKSGGTIEPNSFLAFFHERAAKRLGPAEVGARFAAITDPGSPLEGVAKQHGFGATVYGVPSVGGRFSALSAFGMAPAALLGLDVRDFLARAQVMAEACGPEAPAEANPGIALGLAIGALAAAGRDKLTLVQSPRIAVLGAWLEQLVAESTGKQGRGIIPIDGEPLPDPKRSDSIAAVSADRLFVYTRLAGNADPAQDAAIDALVAAGQPVIRIGLADLRDLGQEFFRWEIATAVAGSVLGVNPFDQPDVEAAKIAARALMERYERSGALAQPKPLLEEAELVAFADPALAGASLDDVLRGQLARIGRGDYFAINAYVEMCDANDAPLQRIRGAVAGATRVATTLGYGPRFLHSTGQLHKGGPGSGVFLQITSDDEPDLAIPGQRYTFGVLKQAQALGDFDVLVERGRRALHLHLRGDVERGLAALADRCERLTS